MSDPRVSLSSSFTIDSDDEGRGGHEEIELHKPLLGHHGPDLNSPRSKHARQGSGSLPRHHRRTSSGMPSSPGRHFLPAFVARNLPSRIRAPLSRVLSALPLNRDAFVRLKSSSPTTLFAIYTACAVLGLYLCAQFVYVRHRAYVNSAYAAPYVPVPHKLEPTVEPVTPAELAASKSPPDSLQASRHALNKRFSEMGLQPTTLACALSDTDRVRYSSILRGSATGGRILFALNLWNNEEVLPTLASTLTEVAFLLGHSRVHISIFENGSTDRTTVALAHFAASLTAAGVNHTIVSDETKTKWQEVDRIAQLSVYRNVALHPLEQEQFDTVVFVNDVYLCPRDALELLYQKETQNAHAACGLDWRATASPFELFGFLSVKFYDNWVTRSIKGGMLRSRFDILSESRDGVNELFDQAGEEASRDRFRAGLPLSVYSCWNGLVALDARPFLGVESAKKGGRSEEGKVRFRSALNTGTCAASECKILARDYWARGFDRWVLVPSVHVTYTQDIYTHPSLVDLAARSPRDRNSEKIDWSEVKPPESVVCYPWARGFHLDLPYRRTREPAWRW